MESRTPKQFEQTKDKRDSFSYLRGYDHRGVFIHSYIWYSKRNTTINFSLDQLQAQPKRMINPF